MAGIDGMDPRMASIVQRIIEESGGRVTVVSGYRTRQEQAALYQKYLNGTGNLAAKPGHSAHEHGLAVDFGGDLDLAAQLAAKYGLINSVPGEPWHFSLGEEGQGAIPAAGYNLDEEAVKENPQDALASRLHSVLSIIGQDATTGTPGATSPSFEDAGADAAFSMGGEIPATDEGRAAGGAKTQLQQYAAQKLMEQGMNNTAEIDALVKLWDRESGWNPQAQNPTSTAFGIAQFLNGTWKGTGFEKTSDPYQQIDAGLAYIKARYGTPSNALNFHLQNNWY